MAPRKTRKGVAKRQVNKKATATATAAAAALTITRQPTLENTILSAVTEDNLWQKRYNEECK